MKKFKFSLATVLDYKQQILDALKGEHAIILAKVRAQEDLLARIEEQYSTYNLEFRDRKLEGLSIAEALLYEGGLRVLERDIRRETEVLHRLNKEEEAKRAQVVAAKQETASLEKLKEKKLQSYNHEVQKAEERMIDEFISTTRVQQAGA